jgi:hypothetical protein
MTKSRLFGAAALLSCALAGPAMAQDVILHPGYYARGTYCLNKEPGNPYDPRDDYQHWSGWRARGGWDSRGDWSCLYHSPAYYPDSGF